MSGFILLLKFIHVRACILFEQSDAHIFVYYLFVNVGQVHVTLFMDKYLMAIYLSLGKYKLLLFAHPCNGLKFRPFYLFWFSSKVSKLFIIRE